VGPAIQALLATGALVAPTALMGAAGGTLPVHGLRKRKNYRAAFDGFDPERIARYDEAESALCSRRSCGVAHRGDLQRER